MKAMYKAVFCICGLWALSTLSINNIGYAQMGPGAGMMQMPQINILNFSQQPSVHALDVFRRIKTALAVPREAIGIAANAYVPNAMAVAVPFYGPTPPYGQIGIVRIEKLILYNPGFMTQMEITTGSKWAGISIIAHEVGHHIGNHVTPQNQFEASRLPWQKELEADYYSGKALALLGASTDDLQKAQRQMFTLWGSPSHPDTIRRIQNINRGWVDGRGSGNVETDLARIWNEIQTELQKWYQ